jgi:peptidoglycan/LPS O-acetylase OafA/YrhL
MTSIQPKTKDRLEALDALRGLACLGILLYHYTIRFHQVFSGQPGDMLESRWFNSRFFFLISGFVIFLTLSRTRRAVDFAVSRFSRLYPAYWTAVIFTFLLLTIFPLPERIPSLGGALVNLTMLQFWFRVPDVDGVYWTLAIELSFYGLMLVIFKLGWLKHINLFGVAWMILQVTRTFLAHLLGHNIPNYIGWSLSLDYWHLFFAGIVFYQIRTDGLTPARLGYLAAALLTQGILHGYEAMIVAAGFFAVFFLFVYNALNFLAVKPLLFFGTISYSLYLVHQNLGYVVLRHLLPLGVPFWLAVSVATVLSILVATLLTYLIERPSMRGIRRRYKAWREKNPVPSPERQLATG